MKPASRLTQEILRRFIIDRGPAASLALLKMHIRDDRFPLTEEDMLNVAAGKHVRRQTLWKVDRALVRYSFMLHMPTGVFERRA